MFISEEEAKAVQAVAGAVNETAITVREGVNALQDLGTFLSPYVSPVVEQVGMYFADKMRYIRAENAIRFQQRLGCLLESVGPAQIRSVPLNVVVPLLENVLIEEDELVQDMWASLLANGIDSDSGLDVSKGYIGLLKDMGPLEAKCLKKLVDVYRSDKKSMNPFCGLRINTLPTSISDSTTDETIPDTPQNVLIAIHNLKRLGCIEEFSNFETPPPFDSQFSNGVTPTFLGLVLIEACTR